MIQTTTNDWQALALELANVSAELVTVARAVAGDGRTKCPSIAPDEWLRGLLNNHANDVSAVVERIAEKYVARDTLRLPDDC